MKSGIIRTFFLLTISLLFHESVGSIHQRWLQVFHRHIFVPRVRLRVNQPLFHSVASPTLLDETNCSWNLHGFDCTLIPRGGNDDENSGDDNLSEIDSLIQSNEEDSLGEGSARRKRIKKASSVKTAAGDEKEEDSHENFEQNEIIEKKKIVLEGSLLDALRIARSNARLLVVFLPVTAHKKGSQKQLQSPPSNDQICRSSLSSDNVYHVAEKAFRKNTKLQEPMGSYYVWTSPFGSTESSHAISILKRLKGIIYPLKNKSSPYLLVLYPAPAVDSLSGKPKIVPRLLAQHHCNPPPSADGMSSWLLSLRQRYKKLYASMHRDLVEMNYLRERTVGYSESLKVNQDLEEKEKREEQERIEKETREKERLLYVEERRKTLVASLPEEPTEEENKNIVTIALRFSNGRSGRRRFFDDTTVSTLFDWVDAMYGVEREKVELTTMTGHKIFRYGSDLDGLTIKDMGLGRLFSLRVLEKTNVAVSDPPSIKLEEENPKRITKETKTKLAELADQD